MSASRETGKGGAVLKTRLLVLETAGIKLDSCLSAKLSRAWLHYAEE